MPSLPELIYSRSPVWAQNFGISAFGYWWQRRRFGGVFREQLAEFRRRDTFTAAEWTAYLTAELRKIIVHAFESVPFYNERYKRHGLTADKLARLELDQLDQLPVVEKEDLRAFGTTTMLSVQPERGGRFFSSSGSTGTPTQILYSERLHQTWTAGHEARSKNWAGVDMHMRRGMIGGRRILPSHELVPPYHRVNWFENQAYFSAYHLTPETVGEYVRAIRDEQVEFMMGYAFSNYLVAKYALDGGIEAPRLKAVVTSSEKLTPEMRSTLQRAYGCRAYDFWGGVEACGAISECEHGSLHVSPDIGILEFLRANGTTAQAGEPGEILCTSLINRSQPLIRFRCGDVATPVAGTCACGRHMPMVSEIIGRNEDVITGPDGRQMVRFHSIFVNLPQVQLSQVIQETRLDYELRIVATTELMPQDIKTMTDRVRSQLGDVNVRVNQVDAIPLGKNGKFKAVVSKVGSKWK